MGQAVRLIRRPALLLFLLSIVHCSLVKALELPVLKDQPQTEGIPWQGQQGVSERVEEIMERGKLHAEEAKARHTFPRKLFGPPPFSQIVTNDLAQPSGPAAWAYLWDLPAP